MIDRFTIFHKGGRVLWQKAFVNLRGNPINQLVKSVLLEDRVGETTFVHDTYRLQWLLANEVDLVFVVVFQKIIQILYADELLQRVKAAFCSMFQTMLTQAVIVNSWFESFDEVFMKILRSVELEFEETKQPAVVPTSKTDLADTATKADLAKQSSSGGDSSSSKSRGSTTPPPASASPTTATPPLPAPPSTPADREAFIRKVLESKGCRIKGKTSTPKSAAAPTSAGAAAATNKKKIKQNAEGWKEPHKLDKSALGPSEVSEQEVERYLKEYGPTGEVSQNYANEWNSPEGDDENDDQGSEDEVECKDPSSKVKFDLAASQVSKPQRKGGLFKLFSKLPFTSSAISAEDLQPVMTAMKERLITKNVAAEIADKLTDSVSATLLGKTLGGFSRLSPKVFEAMEQTLGRVLAPIRDVNILRDIQRVQAEGRRERGGNPYSIVFCGVNGVGKSTSLAKVAYWLRHNGLSVMLAACDTFRSGAVEQLRVHARCLQIPLFEKGYNKDAAAIASEALLAARKAGTDVVLIDTAGRMQDNEPLMRALAKLIGVNHPDLVLFVGEALVGNDAVDQVLKFNQCLSELADAPGNPRVIDGIVLTKFDTIDDKVGAAISMVYATGKPIVFVGVGQTYTDLKHLNPKIVVQLLLS